MILAHGIINQIGVEVSAAILDAVVGDSLLSPELRAFVERAARLLEHEPGPYAESTLEIKTALKYRLEGMKA